VAFRFQGGGHLSAGARDVVVADGQGTILPRRILHTQRNGDTWVAYRGTDAEGRVHVYYGGSRPINAPASNWRPRLSLMLRTMPLPAGAFEDAKPIASAAQSAGIHGMGFVDMINLGHNPYGPDDAFASAFTGYLQIKKPGRYHIFTVSDDASFVFLDGKPLCSWPGKHEVWKGRHGEHGRTLELREGVYRLDYYHAEDKDTSIMALGWTPPWMAREKKGKTVKVELVPKDAFLHTPVARVGRPERYGDEPLAALRWSQTDQLLSPKHQYTRIEFRSECRKVPEGGKVQWSFGDGTSDTGTDTRDHVYVGDGPFTCAVRVVDEDRKVLDEFRTVVRPETPMENLTYEDENPLGHYIRCVADYACTSVSDDTMEALWDLVDITEDVQLIRSFCEAMVKQFGLKGVGWEAGDRLALALTVKDPTRAEALYARLASGAPTSLDAARCRVERIELVLHRLKDPGRAMAMAKSLRSQGTGMEPRLGVVKMGDVHRARGEFKEAEALYRAAAKVAYGATDRRLVAMRQGGYIETADTYIRDGFLRAARELLIKWEARYPDGKLGGDLVLMTAKYFEKLGDPQRALDELTTFAKINPLSPYLPEVELRMARAHARLGNRAEASRLYDKVISEYPRSREADQARRERYER
jgi:tetratricopeptide (TPR) repeat protein